MSVGLVKGIKTLQTAFEMNAMDYQLISSCDG
jgi:hypothetical protein